MTVPFFRGRSAEDQWEKVLNTLACIRPFCASEMEFPSLGAIVYTIRPADLLDLTIDPPLCDSSLLS